MNISSDRRREPRLDREERLFIRQVSSSNPDFEQAILRGKTVDLSAGGLCLISSKEIPAGTRLELWVELQGRKAKFMLNSAVRWCKRKEGTEAWTVGVVLVDVPGSDWSRWQLMFPSVLVHDELI